MKNLSHSIGKWQLVVFVLSFVLFSSMAWVKLTLIQPAEITLDPHIKKISIIYRAPEERKNNDILGKLEEVLTGELLQQDVQAVENLMNGIKDMTVGTKRIDIIKENRTLAGGSESYVFPNPLSWQTVNRICQSSGTNAVLAIEIFDTDFIVTNTKKEVQSKDKEGNAKKETAYVVKGVATIKIGIRFYDNIEKSIIDEYKFTDHNTWEESGKSIQDGISKLLDKTAAINKISYSEGNNYGKRISPYYYTVKREFYNKPKKNKKLAEGVRKSEVADWKGAIESWQKCIDKYDKKATPRAAYNIAVAYEVLGDLDKAVEWSRKAFVEYNEKRADEYYHILQNRIQREAILESQMPE